MSERAEPAAWAGALTQAVCQLPDACGFPHTEHQNVWHEQGWAVPTPVARVN